MWPFYAYLRSAVVAGHDIVSLPFRLPTAPHSPNKLVSTSMLSRILVQARTQPGTSRRRPWPGSSSIRGQRDLACSRFPISTTHLSASFTVDRRIIRRSTIPVTLPSLSRITEYLSTSRTLFQFLGTRQTVINTRRNVVV
jgi:hypothetical protein